MPELAVWAVAGFGFLAATGWGLVIYYRSLLVKANDVNVALAEELKTERRRRFNGTQQLRRLGRDLEELATEFAEGLVRRLSGEVDSATK